jgi:hypothetical protein
MDGFESKPPTFHGCILKIENLPPHPSSGKLASKPNGNNGVSKRKQQVRSNTSNAISLLMLHQ